MRQILIATVAAILLTTSFSASVFARGGDSGGDREVSRGTDDYFNDSTEDRSDSRSKNPRTADLHLTGCDLEMDFQVNNVCYDGRL